MCCCRIPIEEWQDRLLKLGLELPCFSLEIRDSNLSGESESRELGSPLPWGKQVRADGVYPHQY